MMAITTRGQSIAAAKEYDEARKRRLAQAEAEKPVRRTSAGLRDALFDEIDALRRGDGDAQRATAVARLATNILAAAKLELDFKKAAVPESERLKTIELGTVPEIQKPADDSEN